MLLYLVRVLSICRYLHQVRPTATANRRPERTALCSLTQDRCALLCTHPRSDSTSRRARRFRCRRRRRRREPLVSASNVRHPRVGVSPKSPTAAEPSAEPHSSHAELPSGVHALSEAAIDWLTTPQRVPGSIQCAEIVICVSEIKSNHPTSHRHRRLIV